MNVRLTDIANEYERLVLNGLVFATVDKSLLHPSTVLYLEQILEPSGIEYWIANIRLDGTVLFKLNHPKICFLHHDPVEEKHMWADDGFHNAIPNNKVLALLAELSDRLLPGEVLMSLFDGE